MYYLGWRLTAAAEASDLCRALGEGLMETARVFFALQLLLHTCGRQRTGGVAFRLAGRGAEIAPPNIRWFSLPALPLMCVAVAMAWQENDRWDTSLGRICFMRRCCSLPWLCSGFCARPAWCSKPWWRPGGAAGSIVFGTFGIRSAS